MCSPWRHGQGSVSSRVSTFVRENGETQRHNRETTHAAQSRSDLPPRRSSSSSSKANDETTTLRMRARRLGSKSKEMQQLTDTQQPLRPPHPHKRATAPPASGHAHCTTIHRKLDLGPRTDYIWNIGDGRQGESGDLCAHHASSCLDRHHPERHHPERHTAQKKEEGRSRTIEHRTAIRRMRKGNRIRKHVGHATPRPATCECRETIQNEPPHPEPHHPTEPRRRPTPRARSGDRTRNNTVSYRNRKRNGFVKNKIAA